MNPKIKMPLCCTEALVNVLVNVYTCTEEKKFKTNVEALSVHFKSKLKQSIEDKGIVLSKISSQSVD